MGSIEHIVTQLRSTRTMRRHIALVCERAWLERRHILSSVAQWHSTTKTSYTTQASAATDGNQRLQSTSSPVSDLPYTISRWKSLQYRLRIYFTWVGMRPRTSDDSMPETTGTAMDILLSKVTTSCLSCTLFIAYRPDIMKHLLHIGTPCLNAISSLSCFTACLATSRLQLRVYIE